MQLHPYLEFDGKCEEAFTMYKDVFGVKEFESVLRFSDLPKSEDMKVEDEEKNNIMHMSMAVSPNFKLMGSDVPAANKSTHVNGSSVTVAVVLTDTVKAEEVFKKLSEGGTVLMPMAKMFWGSLFGKCQDKFGIYWQVDCFLNENKKQKTEHEAEDKMDTTEENPENGETNPANGEAKTETVAEAVAETETTEAKTETAEAKTETGTAAVETKTETTEEKAETTEEKTETTEVKTDSAKPAETKEE